MITFKNFNYKYIESKQLNIENLSLEINKGECVLFTGASGCGKTTIMRVLNGLAPEFFDGGFSGEFKVAHLSIGDRLKEFSKVVGSVFQNPKNQFFNLDSTSELAFSMENYGYSKSEIQNRIDEVVSDFSAEYLLDRNILELSGGEKQRISIARCLLKNSPIVILDEITAYSDIENEAKIQSAIRNLLKDKTAIIIAHRLYTIKDVDNIVVLNEGEIVESGKHQDLITKENGLYKHLWEVK